MVSSYLEIQEKLSADTTEGVEALGATVAREAQALQGEGGVERIIEGARGFSDRSLEQSRLTFKKLSAGMIENLRSQTARQAGLMIVHCSMTFGGEGGSWVQQVGPVRNPYEGKRMLECGDKVPWSG